MGAVVGRGQKMGGAVYGPGGTRVEGHWQTPEDLRKEKNSTPGKVDPDTGRFNPYTGSGAGPLPANRTALNPTPPTTNP